MRALTLCSALCLAAVTTLPAQSTVSLAPYAAVDESLPGRPLLFGLGLGVTRGMIGVRASAAMAHEASQPGGPADPSKTGSRTIAGDLVVVLGAGRRAGAAGAFGPIDPRLFAGIGVRNNVADTSVSGAETTISVGTGLSYSLLSRVRLDIEARRRVPIAAVSDLFETERGALEYRAGLSFHFGKGNLRPSRGVLVSAPRLPDPVAEDEPVVEREAASASATAVLLNAEPLLGTPYVWGGSSPSGFDCSGFVQYVFARNGVYLPRTSREMALVGEPVPTDLSALQPGDLMFFANPGEGISHVAIYAGDKTIVHSSRSGRGVGYDDLSVSRGRYFTQRFVEARRVLGTNDRRLLAGNDRRPASVKASSPIAPKFAGDASSPLMAFLKAAGLPELSEVAKKLYRPDETPDAPDKAPARRF